MALEPSLSHLCAKRADASYSVVILGDTHFDTEPADVYHSNYNEPVEWLNRVQRQEFARNGEMWRDRCPRLLQRASRLITPDTRMVFQMGDLIQGDCGKGEVHQKMLDDVLNNFKQQLGGLPFVTVVGNHDIRGVDAEQTYCTYMPQRMSQELGKDIRKTTFSFSIGEDAYLVLDFNRPDDEEIEKLLKETQGARHTFVIVHGPLFPYESSSPRWFFHGKDSEKHTAARRHFRQLFAQRNVICLCGHTHNIEFIDWHGDGGRITQMTMSSVWSKGMEGYKVRLNSPNQFGELASKIKTKPNGQPTVDESALFAEYRPGMQQYCHATGAGCFKLHVSKRHVSVDFFFGDSEAITQTFILR